MSRIAAFCLAVLWGSPVWQATADTARSKARIPRDKEAARVRDIHFMNRRQGWLLLHVGRPEEETQSWEVWRTRNAGSAWNMAGRVGIDGAWSRFGDIFFIDSNQGWLRDGRLFSTRDGGKTWHREPLNGTVTALEEQGRAIWALVGRWKADGPATPAVIYEWSRHRPSWAPLPAPPPLREASALFRFDPDHAWVWRQDDDSEELFVTRDAGRSWSKATHPCVSEGLRDPKYPLGFGEPFRMASGSGNRIWLLCRGEGGAGMQMRSLFESRDLGNKRVGPVSGGGIMGGYADELAVSSGDRLWITLGRTGLTRLDDGGRRRRTAIAGIESASDCWGPIFFAGPRHGWTTNSCSYWQTDAEGNGSEVEGEWLFRTRDGGLSWERLLLFP